jgi:hypothetical protein
MMSREWMKMDMEVTILEKVTADPQIPPVESP